MAKNLCAAAVEEEAQNPGLPRYLIFRLQPVPALLPEQRVELLPMATAPELARHPQKPSGRGSSPRMAPLVFLEAASESFPALAFLFLFWLLSPSQIFYLWTTPFSFAIFSSHLLVLASGWETFSISLEPQLIQAFRSVLALAFPLLPPQILSPASPCYDPAILLTFARLRRVPFPSSNLLLPASLSGSDLVISRVPGKRSVSSSTCLPPLWL